MIQKRLKNFHLKTKKMLKMQLLKSIKMNSRLKALRASHSKEILTLLLGLQLCNKMHQEN